MRIAVVGFGYWGPNIARVFRNDGWDVLVIDEDSIRIREAVKQGYTTRSVWNPEARDVDAVAICTPPHTHFDLALRALENGKDVLVTKPLATTYADAMTLVDAAQTHGRALMVDHTFLYSPAVRRLVNEFSRCEPTFYDSVRFNLGTTASGDNVLWDLGSHDVSIMLDVVGRPPEYVDATMNGKHQAHITYHFDGLIAHSHLSWVAPAKVRQTIVGCDTKMVVYDDVSASEKIKIYSVGGDMDKLVDYRLGDIRVPALSTIEPLLNMARAFRAGCSISAVEVSAPLTIKVLEAAHRATQTREWVKV